MKSIRTALVLVVVALAALALPAMSSANWTKEGQEIASSIRWSQEGTELKSETPLTVQGNLRIQSVVLGTVDCPMSGAVTMNPPAGGSLNGFYSNAAKCELSGAIKFFCTGVSSVTSQGGPVALKEVAGKRVIEISPVTVNYDFTGSKECEEIDLSVSGSITATPDNSNQISSLALSGQLTSPDFGKQNIANSALSVTPAKKHGILPAGPQEVTLTGEIGWSSPTLGSRKCQLNGTAILKPGTEGELTSLTPSNCQSGGPAGMAPCTFTSFTFNSLPWTLVDQGTSIAIKNVSIGDCYIGTTTGELTATPDKAGGISETSLSGWLQSPLYKNISWTGKLNWTPVGVYGL